ncbi:MAG: hypothetical protein ACTTH8_01155 [Treponema sp.]
MEMISEIRGKQRFEYTFELAWKTLKDKMEFDGISFERTYRSCGRVAA